MACGKWWQSISLHWNKGDDNLKKRKFANAAVMLILLSVVGYTFFGSPVEMYRRGELRKAMSAVEDGEVTLNEIVPFAWDSVYSFGPYTTQEQMEEIMGISARRLEESPSEGMVQLVFVNGGQIVCGVCGYISKEGYSVSFDEKINFADNVVFRAKRDADGILWLTEPHD